MYSISVHPVTPPCPTHSHPLTLSLLLPSSCRCVRTTVAALRAVVRDEPRSQNRRPRGLGRWPTSPFDACSRFGLAGSGCRARRRLALRIADSDLERSSRAGRFTHRAATRIVDAGGAARGIDPGSFHAVCPGAICPWSRPSLSPVASACARRRRALVGRTDFP